VGAFLDGAFLDVVPRLIAGGGAFRVGSFCFSFLLSLGVSFSGVLVSLDFFGGWSTRFDGGERVDVDTLEVPSLGVALTWR